MAKTILKHYARWMGYTESITHTRNGLYPYVFRKGEWIEIVEADSEWYQNKADRNLEWEYETQKVLKTETIHMVRFMGVPGKKQINYELVDHKFGTDETIKGTMRKYVFKAKIWIEILEKDVARFQRKAGANVSWEFETEYVPIGSKPARLGGLALEEEDDVIEDPPEKKPKKKGKKKEEPVEAPPEEEEEEEEDPVDEDLEEEEDLEEDLEEEVTE